MAFGMSSPKLHVHHITKTSETLGTKLPPAVAKAIERYDRRNTAAESIGLSEAVLYAAVTAAIDNGTDPAADPEVQRISTAQRLALPGVTAGVRDIAEDELTEVIRVNADKIIGTWQAPFDIAAHDIAKAHNILGDIPLADTLHVVSMGAHATEAWAAANTAADTLNTVSKAWAALIGASSSAIGRLPDNRYAVCRIADPSPEQWADLDRKASPWDLQLAGVTFDLADTATYRARVAALNQPAPESVPS